MEKKKIVITQKNTPEGGDKTVVQPPQREKIRLGGGKNSEKKPEEKNTSYGLPKRGQRNRKEQFATLWEQRSVKMTVIGIPVFFLLIFMGSKINFGTPSNNPVISAIDTIEKTDSSEQETTPIVNNNIHPSSDSSLSMTQITVKENDNNTLESVLSKVNLTKEAMDELVKVGNTNPHLRTLQSGRDVSIYSSKEDKTPKYLIYKTESGQEILFDLQEKIIHSTNNQIFVLKNQPVLIRKEEDGFIYSILDNNLRHELSEVMEKALKWSIDLWHVKQGDKYQVIYEEIQDRNKKATGVKGVKAICFETQGKKIYAIAQNTGSGIEFFDMNGKALKGGFLKAPLAVPRITSGFQKNRMHPVDKVVRDHGGTDYGAPEGTEIFSVADGTVIELGNNPGGNGNFIAVKHDNVYSTKYLHMSKHGEGMQIGTKVIQGQVIGYVGQTGKATGPHLCFRFRKNGVEVNPLEEVLPSSGTPLPAQYQPNFNAFRDSVVRVFAETRTFL